MIFYSLLVFMFSYTVIAFNERGLWDIINELLTTDVITDISEDATLNISQLVTKYGYIFQEYSVITKDGYILNVHRIQKDNRKRLKPIVFLMHGIMESSDCWVLQGPNLSLAYLLADHDFDVWLGNARGNKHALNHIQLTHTMPEFWKFSWEEIGLYDLPAMIDFILLRTNMHSLYYVGHSQGTTTFYVMCSLKPEYNKVVKMMFSLAPEAWMEHIKSPLLKMFSPAHNVIGYLLQDVNTYMAGTEFFKKIATYTCHVMPFVCNNIIYAISGPDHKIQNSVLNIMLGHMPTGSSTLQFVHYGQLVTSKRFCRYDFGPEVNLLVYNNEVPPEYDLKKVVVPIIIFYSNADYLSAKKDVETLMSHLPNIHSHNLLEDFNHLDYVYSSEAVELIYHRIIDEIYTME